MYKIEQNDINLADYWTWRTVRKWTDTVTEDDKQDGRAALCEAARDWKPEKGKFWSFAPTVIKRMVYRVRFGGGNQHRGKGDLMGLPEYGTELKDYHLPANLRTPEDMTCDKDEIEKTIATMYPWMVDAIMRKEFYGEEFKEICKERDVPFGVFRQLLYMCRKGRRGHYVTEKQREKYWGKDPIDIEKLVSEYISD
jgi:hypothetical protein